MAYTKPRIEVTAAKYAENSIRAALGDESARQYIAAADNTTDNLIPALEGLVNGLTRSGKQGLTKAFYDAGTGAVTFAEARQPEFKEKKGEGYIQYGDRNDYPNYLVVKVQKILYKIFSLYFSCEPL